MSHPSSVPAPPALAGASFPEEILTVLRTLKREGFAAYLVGGSIRDRLLGKEAKDHDVATSARAEVVAKMFRRVIPTGIKHGTVTVLIHRTGVEVTTFRGEGEYLDGRRPESVVFLEDVVEDLARRDFTINAMAYDPDARALVDPFGGAADLERRLVRCVGEARLRFSEDGLRPMRAVRFASVLGFEIEQGTLEAIPATLETFGKVAHERVREELTKLLVGQHPSRGIRLLRQTGLLARILPEVEALSGLRPAAGRDGFELALARLDALPADLELRLAALLFDVPELPAAGAPPKGGPIAAALDRLRYPGKTIELGARLVEHRGFGLAAGRDAPELRRALSRVGRELVAPLFELARAQARALGDQALLSQVEDLASQVAELLAGRPALTTNELAIDGKRVMQLLGIPPGPRIGEAMRFLLDRVLERPELNETSALVALLEGWKNAGESPG